MSEQVDARASATHSTGKARGPGELVHFPKDRGRSRVIHRYWVGAGVLIVILALALFVWWSLGSKEALHFSTVPVSRGAITRSVVATGTVNPELTIIVGTYVSGVIQELYCDYNTQVKRGQVCAKIDPRPYQSVVNESKANLAVGKAQLLKDQASLAYAKVNYERNRLLAEKNAVSQDVADNAKNLYDQAQAQITFDQATIEQRQAELDSAQVNLDYTNIVSPVDGTVVSRSVTMGQTVAASFQTPTLFLIASDLKKMEVDTNVSESDIGDLREGNPSSFTVDAFPNRTFEGKVSQIRQSPQTIQNVVTFDVVVSVDNSDLALRPGMTAATRIVTDERNDVIRVPSQALRYMPSGTQGQGTQARVWVLRAGKPEAVSVELGLDDDSFVEIVNGKLNPGDPVIIAEQRQSSKRVLPPRL